MGKFKHIYVLFFLIFGFAYSTFSQDCIPEKGKKLVYNNTNILSIEEENYLNKKLIAYNDSTSTQIAVVVVQNLCGHDRVQFADELGEKWGVGQKEKDNGIVILVKPRTIGSRGQMHISVGYGLEGVITDGIAGQIRDYKMIPYFKKEQYFEGINAAVDEIMLRASGLYKGSGPQEGINPIFIVLIIIVIIIIVASFGRKNDDYEDYDRRGRKHYGGTPWIFWGGGGSGGSSGGGFGGGGFGGFGGGGFGGGGAGGSW